MTRPEWDIEIYDVLESTQRLLKNRAAEGVPEGRVIQAHSQQSGQGRFGNHWESPPGNLYVSLLLRPARAAHDGQWASLSYCAGLAMARTLADHIDDGSTIRLKWPNDILINKRKISGILLDMQLRETRPDWVVIGVGVNIATAPEGATYLQAHGDNSVQPNQIRDDFLVNFSDIYKKWLENGFKCFHAAWLAYAPDLRGRVTARTPHGEIAGNFVRFDENGAVCLRDDAGREHVITAGELHNVEEVDV